MKIEAIKLSPKKAGNGYTSSYSVSIGRREIEICELSNKRIIKCIDGENCQIVIRAKKYSLNIDIIQRVCKLKRMENKNSKKFGSQPIKAMWNSWIADKETMSKNELRSYLSTLSMESIMDLVLLMYMGREFDVDMQQEPGEERFLEFYDRYGDIVLGQEKATLISVLLGKEPLSIYLESGLRLLCAPRGTNIDELRFLDWGELEDCWI